MAYRGDDLDLRTPQGWSSTGRDTGAGEQPNWHTRSTIYKGGRGDPIWVDDNVMACCNHAHDLALAHRAPEVRLEHLINALTLNDSAAVVLEARGLGVASLRRESGQYIANEIPAGSGGHSVPKRSEAMEEALRLAADQAYPRRTPITVDDLLHVLFDMKRDLPGLQLLHRHSSPRNGRNGADLRLEPLPHLVRPQATDGRYAPISTPAPWPKYASPAAHDYFGQAARETPPTREPAPTTREHISRDHVTREPSRSPVREPSVRDLQTPSGTVDGVQNNRIDSLERAVRDLGIDLADDRKSLQALVGDLQRSAATQADDAGRFRGSLADRLASLEDTLVRSRSDQAAVPAAFMDRVAAIERNIEARLTDISRAPANSPMQLERLAAIERNIEARLVDLGRAPPVPQIVLERLAAIERNIEVRLAEVGRGPAVAPIVLDRLAAMERNIEARLVDVSRGSVAMDERMQTFELASHRPVEATLTPLVSQRLESITAFGGKVDALERTFQLILDRITGLERKLSNPGEARTIDFNPLEIKLASLEGTLVNAVRQGSNLAPMTEMLSGIDGRVAGLERTLDNRTAETGRTVSFIGERLRAFEEAIAGQRNAVGERLQAFEEAIGGQRNQTAERLAQIERALTVYAESTTATAGAHERELTEVHEALLKLNGNQQTLAGSLDQWRLDNTGDLSVISNRLKGIEDVNVRRAPMVEAMAGQIGNIHSALAKREVRKSRFRHWLLGTDEWYSASYDTQRWRKRMTEDNVLQTVETLPMQQRPTPPAPPPSALRR